MTRTYVIILSRDTEDKNVREEKLFTFEADCLGVAQDKAKEMYGQGPWNYWSVITLAEWISLNRVF